MLNTLIYNIMELEQNVKSNLDKMQDTVDALAAQRNEAINQLANPELCTVDCIRLCRYVVFVENQITDLTERLALARLLNEK